MLIVMRRRGRILPLLLLLLLQLLLFLRGITAVNLFATGKNAA